MDKPQVGCRRCRSSLGDVRPHPAVRATVAPGRVRDRAPRRPDGRGRRLRAGEHRRPRGDRKHPQRRARRERQERLRGRRSGRPAGAVPPEQRPVDADLPVPRRECRRDARGEQPPGRRLVRDAIRHRRRRQLPLSRPARCRQRQSERAGDRDRLRRDAERGDPADPGRRRGLDRAAGIRRRQRHRPRQPQLQRQRGRSGDDADERQRHRQRLGDLQRRRHRRRRDRPESGRLQRGGPAGHDDARPG